jgi:hypothetical protein
MKWLDRGNLVASAVGIGVRLDQVATWLPRDGAFETNQKLNDDLQGDLRLNDRRALQ